MDKIKDTLQEELEKDSPDRDRVLSLMEALQQAEPVETVPLEAVKKWQAIRAPGEKRGEKNLWRKIGKIAAVFAAVFVLFGAIPSVLGMENMFEKFGRWTSELLSFGQTEGTEPRAFQSEHEGLCDLYNVMIAMGMTDNVVPSWLPEEYELLHIEQTDTPNGKNVAAMFIQGNKFIKIAYCFSNSMRGMVYPKDNPDAEIREHNGEMIHIVNNEGEYSAVWLSSENIECAIFAGERQELDRMLGSIS